MGRRRSLLTTLRHYFLFLVSLAIFASVSWGLARQIIRRYTVSEDLARLQREAERIERENEELRTLIEYTKTPQFIEREARLKKGLKAPDEEVVVVRGMDIGTEITSVIPDTRTNPQKWIDYLIKGLE